MALASLSVSWWSATFSIPCALLLGLPGGSLQFLVDVLDHAVVVHSVGLRDLILGQAEQLGAHGGVTLLVIDRRPSFGGHGLECRVIVDLVRIRRQAVVLAQDGDSLGLERPVILAPFGGGPQQALGQVALLIELLGAGGQASVQYLDCAVIAQQPALKTGLLQLVGIARA